MKKIPTIKAIAIYEKAALKAYPEKVEKYTTMYGNDNFGLDLNKDKRAIYQQGYEQAYKDILKKAEEWFEGGCMIDYFFMDGMAKYCRSSDAYKGFKKYINNL